MARWSLYRPEQFIKTIQGIPVGIGTHPAVNMVGVWNIFCLVATNLDQIKNYSGPIENYPAYSHWLPIAVGTSMQQLPGEVETLGQKADLMKPQEFLDCVKDFTILIPRMILGDEAWNKRKAEALEEFSWHGDNVVSVDFRRAH